MIRVTRLFFLVALILAAPLVLAAVGKAPVYPRGAIGAPLSVNTATIVFPVEGTIVSNSDAVYPRALLAMSGSGTVVGAWAVDGVPFDRFTAITNAGAPLEIRAHVPIPPTSWGEHRLSLIIDSPKFLNASGPTTTNNDNGATAGPSVKFESSATSATRLTIYEPAERALIEGVPRIRWTLVPGASAYEVEILHVAGDGRELGSRRFRTTEISWTPKDLGNGMMRLRVRAIFQGDTRGEPTEWRTFVVLPAKASLHIDGAADRRVAWSGGSLGMIYRVEFLRGESRCFEALSFSSPYRMATSIEWRNCDAVRVDAFSPSGTLLGKSQLVTLGKSFAPPIALVAGREPVDVIERLPRAGTISGGLTSVAARWRTGAQENSALLVDGTDVTAVAMRQPRAIIYDALLPLAAGKHVAALASAGALDEWTFNLSDDPTPSSPAVTNPPTYVIQPSGSVEVQRAHPASDQITGSVSLSAQGAVGDVTAGNGVQATGDLVYAGGLDPNHLSQASRNWLGQGRTSYGPMWGSARVGYTTPDFTDGAEFLTSGTARTGVVARAGSAWGTLSYYQPVDPQVHGVLSASPENLGIRSAAFATPDGKPYLIRVIALRLQEPADPLLHTTENTTRNFGIFARYDFGPKGLLSAEAAHGSVTPQAGSAQVSRSGDAIRLTANGVLAGTTYSADLRTVDANYLNPGNRSLIPGTGEHFTLGRTFGSNILSLTLGHQEQGQETNSPQHATASAIGLSVTTTFNPRISLITALGVNADHADALLASSLPATSRRNSSASAALSETFSKINVSESLSWSHLDDHISPTANNDVTSMTVAVNGAPITNVALAGSAGFTRTNATPTGVTTDYWTLSLTPSIAFPTHCLSVSPSVTLDRKPDLVATSSVRNQSFGSIVQWSPLWLSSLVSGQISATTTHTASATTPSTRTNVYTAAVTLHLTKTRGLPMFAGPAPLPGTQPPAPPADTSSGPTTAVVAASRGTG